MISRRNIRVKVMQTLYALETMENQPQQQQTGKKLLLQNLEQTSQIYIYLLYFISRVAKYAETDAQNRSFKHLRTEKDMQVNTKIADNELVTALEKDTSFTQKLNEWKLTYKVDDDLVKKLYLQLVTTDQYQQYIANPERDAREEKNIIEYIFNTLLLDNELFDQHMEDAFLHWQDDKTMMSLLVNNYLQKPSLSNFDQLISKEKMEYALELLHTCLDKKDYCHQLIRPKLQNWDPDRIAAIDMLLMEMGICEFLYFPTIPTKVTINEYIDLAKAYSTPQSGQFVNGILDSILKDLEQEQKIQKTDRARN
jgi:transcription antitermination protein NusB